MGSRGALPTEMVWQTIIGRYMEVIANTLREFAKEYNDAQSEERIDALYGEVIGFAASHAHMGHYRVRFDVFWDNNQETRRVCKMLWEEDILSSIINFEDTDITELVLKNEADPQNHRFGAHEGIASLFLSWE